MALNYSTNLRECIETALMEDDWNYYFSEKWGIFQFNLSMENINRISYQVSVGKTSFTTRAYAPVNVPMQRRETVRRLKEFILKINRYLVQGHFELNENTGEILFRAYVDCEGIMPGKEIILNSIVAAASSYEYYGLGFLNIIFGGFTAEEAFAHCEVNEDDPEADEPETYSSSETWEALDLLSRLSEKLGIGFSVDRIEPGQDDIAGE